MPRAARVVVFVVVFLVAFGIYLYWQSTFPPPRPLFHDFYGQGERSNILWPCVWHQNMHVSDGRGNFGFADRTLNLFVLLRTNEPGFGDNVCALATPNEAILLPDTRYSRKVSAEMNTLVVFDSNGLAARFSLPQGEAEELLTLAVRGEWMVHHDLPTFICQSYHGADARALRTSLGKPASHSAASSSSPP